MTLEDVEVVDLVAVKVRVLENGWGVFYFKREAAAALLGCVAAVGVKPHFGGGFIDGAAVGEQRAVFYFEYHAFFLAGVVP